MAKSIRRLQRKKLHLKNASVAICEFLFNFLLKKTKDKRKKRTHKGRGLAICMRIKIDAIIWCRIASARLQIGQILRTDFCGQHSYST